MYRITIWVAVCIVWGALASGATSEEELPTPVLSTRGPQRSVVLTWRQPTTVVPVSRYAIYKANVGGSWVRVALVDGLLRGWEDMSVIGNETIRYYVVSIGSDGAVAPRSNIIVVAVP